jgi:tight adherence protein B
MMGRLTRYVTPHIAPPKASTLDQRFEELVASNAIGRTMLRDLSQLGYDARPGRMIVYGVIVGGVGFGAANLVSGSPILGAVAFLAVIVVEGVAVHWLAGRRLDQYRLQLPEALHVIASAISAGASLNQALHHAARETVPPLQKELRRVVEDVEVGKTLEEALADLKERVPLSDFDMIIASLLIQQRSGGNLAELLVETASILKEAEELRQELSVLTSQARLSAQLVGLLPVGLFVFMYVANPSYLQPLVTEPLGQVMLGVAFVLEVLGFWVVTRIATFSD